MAKKSLSYVCNSCGNESTAWSGKCFACSSWNTLEEQITIDSTTTKSSKKLNTVTLSSVAKKDLYPRISSGIEEVDMVLGGGIVPGSICLIAGQPGIGKSTMLLQLANLVSKTKKVLYVSGEESPHQIALRAQRIGATSDTLQVSTSISADDISANIKSNDFDLVIVDSIQTTVVDAISSAPGTVGQITNSTRLITSAAKQKDVAIILVGHVTKDGFIAGPKVLEHLVDVVLQLDGDRYGGFKILRSVKNRFGSTNETGIFEMQNNGLVTVKNPSAALLAERQITDGSVVLATMEGSRPILVEVQALVNKTSFGYPKRASSGLDLNRLNLLIAMLEKRTKIKLSDSDIYINIVGGIKINEPAGDLAVCMAIGSATKGLKLNKNAVVFGEVGLSGEVRHVPFIDKRLQEAKKLGFDVVIGPKNSSTSSKIFHPVNDIRSALNTFLKS